jgi:hypothetical protein
MVKNYTVEFTTHCYERDWKLILKSRRIEKMISATKYDFTKKTLYINNVNNYAQVAEAAEKLRQNRIIDDFIRIDDHADEVMKFFNVKKGTGYYYLIQNLVQIYLSSCNYMLNFTGDSILINNEEWIDTAIKKMQEDERIIVANALYDGRKDQAMRESIDADDDFYISYGFSDQCYLINPSFYKKDMYNEKNELSLFYPEHARDSFEERIYRYMRNHKLFRITHKRAIYMHKNLGKGRFKTFLALHLGINRKKYRIG